MAVGPVQSSGTTLRPEISVLLEPWDMQAAQRGFIAQDACPFYDVPEAVGIYPKFEISDVLREWDTRRAAGSGYERISRSHTSDTFQTEEHGLEEELDEREVNVNARLYDAEARGARLLRDALMRAHEKAVADFYSSTSWGGSGASSVKWDVKANDIFVDNAEGVQNVEDQCGMPANTIILTSRILNKIRDNEKVIDRIKYSGLDDPKRGENDIYSDGNNGVTPRLLAQAFGVDRILVAGSKRNTANIAQTASLADLWDSDNIYYAYMPDGDPFENSAPCVTLHWDGDGSSHEGMFETYFEDNIRSTILRCRHDKVIKLLNPDCVYKFTGVTT